MASNYGARPPPRTSKLWNITHAPWYVPNAVIRNDLQMPTIKEEIIRLKHPSHPSNNSTLESICLPETKETPVIRSALQIH
jgi:hypothetical protein